MKKSNEKEVQKKYIYFFTKRHIKISTIVGSLILLVFLILQQATFAYPFSPQIPVVIGGDLHLIESADFNKDGKNDLAVTDGKYIRGF